MKKLSLILFALFTATAYSQDAALDSIALTEVTVTSKVVDVAIRILVELRGTFGGLAVQGKFKCFVSVPSVC